MNRTLVFGIATFFAVVGIALIGGDKAAVAGHGCHGNSCSGVVVVGCDGGGCHGGWKHRKHNRGPGLLARLHARKSCHGVQVNNCCGPVAPAPVCCEPVAPVCAPVAPSCCGPVAPACGSNGCEAVFYGESINGHEALDVEETNGNEVDVPDATEAEASDASAQRAPFVFSTVSFRR